MNGIRALSRRCIVCGRLGNGRVWLKKKKKTKTGGAYETGVHFHRSVAIHKINAVSAKKRSRYVIILLFGTHFTTSPSTVVPFPRSSGTPFPSPRDSSIHRFISGGGTRSRIGKTELVKSLLSCLILTKKHEILRSRAPRFRYWCPFVHSITEG